MAPLPVPPKRKDAMDSTTINRILKISESFQMPNILMSILTDVELREKVLQAFVDEGEALDHDWFTQYFEEDHSNKSKMAQDFTPCAVADILADVVGEGAIVADVCSGTGGLSISFWNHYKEKQPTFYCFEYSERAIPLLLLNLSIRNIKAYVWRTNILTGEVFEKYEVIPTDHFSTIAKGDFENLPLADVAISNPPYSQKYDSKYDKNFPGYEGLISSNFGDFAFVAFALNKIKTDGKAGFILPHGVLFRSNKERLFRKCLIDRNSVKTIIGLPEKLFLNTGIPTMIMQLEKSSMDSTTLIIDASNQFTKGGKINLIEHQHVEKICQTAKARQSIKGFSQVVDRSEIIENDYNLNIPRYIDNFVREELQPFTEILDNLSDLDEQIRKAEYKFFDTLSELVGWNQDELKKIKKIKKLKKTTQTEGQMDWSDFL